MVYKIGSGKKLARIFWRWYLKGGSKSKNFAPVNMSGQEKWGEVDLSGSRAKRDSFKSVPYHYFLPQNQFWQKNKSIAKLQVAIWL
jgi:hypothetical protein